MAASDYVTVDEFKADRAIPDGLDDTVLATVITAASRQIDLHCGRRFYLDSGVTTRTYVPSDDGAMYVDDFATTVGLVVVESGTTLVLNTDYYVKPLNALTSWGETSAYYIIQKPYDIRFVNYGQGATVSVTAKWGWPSVPEAVKQATILVANDIKAAWSTTFGVSGIESGVVVRQRLNSNVAAMLTNYVRTDTARGFGFA